MKKKTRSIQHKTGRSEEKIVFKLNFLITGNTGKKSEKITDNKRRTHTHTNTRTQADIVRLDDDSDLEVTRESDLNARERLKQQTTKRVGERAPPSAVTTQNRLPGGEQQQQQQSLKEALL